ncbi:hypothetical protein HOP50_01g03450 [Chloropicon primus]|uniref:Ribosomal RNA-processing protein 14/surfeit locus protein 6 C-terminal domain-containing protein n=2 Tax=Chloropicon primus TaxID=1764295 RepID=A0A5B8MBQ3_9CHLO|nr:hypothetical protein A3770_01p03560 [Chloropicon primus]UPQ97054.1 hypothetical protein HOP50_01g03450 [Chloropicon primus]|eukprot:QDZ17838.1 hypothetical protein A3770_01p03560 [Chloropicon primus]
MTTSLSMGEETVNCSRFLDRLAEMVPAKYFVDTGKVQDTGSQFWHSKSVKAQKKQEAAREGKLRKRDKFDPENAKSTTEKQAEAFKESKRAKARKGGADVDEEDVQFQKVEFNVKYQGGKEPSGAERSQRKKTKQALLKAALKKKEKAAEDKGNEAAWGDAFDRAEGKKVFNDPKKLQKAIKREKKQKEKKSEKWKTIEEDQKAKRDEKQKKRTTNLKERTAKKIQRKINRKK